MCIVSIEISLVFISASFSGHTARVPLLAADVIGNRRSVSKSSPGTVRHVSFLVYENDHPDADGATVAEKRSAVDPSRSAVAFAVFVGACEPSNFCRHTTAFSQRCSQIGANAGAATNSVQEWRLQDARDTKRGRCEKDSERWGGTNEEILRDVSCNPRSSLHATTYVLVNTL
jgi:hypothetical protein